MPIVLPSGFQITSTDPIDSRMTVANQAARLGFSEYNVFDGLIVFQRDTEELYVLTNTASYNLNSGWKLIGSGSGGTVDTGSLMTTASAVNNVITFTKGDTTTFDVTIDTGSSGAEINYVSGSTPYKTIGGIEVLDFDDNVIVDYNQGTQVLKFVFGIPPEPSPTISNTTPLFDVNRFNKVLHTYGVTANFDIGNNTLISASLLEITTGAEKTLQGPVGVGTGFVISENTSGSREYRLVMTSSNPATGNVLSQSIDLDLDLNKGLAGIPTIAYTDSVQLGASGLQIEEGATGTITWSLTPGVENEPNGWIPSSPHFNSYNTTLTVNSTGNVTTGTVSQFWNSGNNNSSLVFHTGETSKTWTRVRSLRYGTSRATSFTNSQLQNLNNWISVGTIKYGYNSESEIESLTINFDPSSSGEYLYIVYDSSLPNINIIMNQTSLFNEITAFNSPDIIGNYKVYRTKALKNGTYEHKITFA